MEKLNNFIKYDKDSLKVELYNAKKSKEFTQLTSMLNVSDDTLCKYTHSLKDSAIEYNNCLNCKGLKDCQNHLEGYCYMPEIINEDTLAFSYIPCKYKKRVLKQEETSKNIDLFDVSENLKNATMKNIYTNDEKRLEVIKFLVSYCEDYNNKTKGLYLYGNFGCGKTYMIAALFNELSKKNIKSAIVYFPEFLRSLKSSFNPNPEEPNFETKYDYIKRVPLLLLDDIGAEYVTPWGRDEILGTLLQYRMDNNLKTFFTSNLSIKELEEHLQSNQSKEDKLNARRISERIKYITDELKIVGINRR